jgi:hypothetical protein
MAFTLLLLAIDELALVSTLASWPLLLLMLHNNLQFVNLSMVLVMMLLLLVMQLI